MTIPDSKGLASVVTALGGTVIPGRTFRFDLPLSAVRETVPKLQQLGVGVRKVDEHQGDDPRRPFHTQSIATLELYRPQKSEYEEERSLMAAIIR